MQDVEILTKSLASHQRARIGSLDLSYNSITDESVAFLAEYLKVQIHYAAYNTNLYLSIIIYSKLLFSIPVHVHNYVSYSVCVESRLLTASTQS